MRGGYHRVPRVSTCGVAGSCVKDGTFGGRAGQRLAVLDAGAIVRRPRLPSPGPVLDVRKSGCSLETHAQPLHYKVRGCVDDVAIRDLH